jgi:hypothetical protein
MLRCVRAWLLLMAAGGCAACGGSDADASPAGKPEAGSSGGAGSGAPAVDALARRLATSPSHTCALRKAGLYCWGANEKGQLGDGSTASSMTPVQAAIAAADLVEVAAHTGHTCVRKRAGTVACWGANDSGQLGDGSRDDSLEPVEPEVDEVKQLALDEKSSCVLRADGSVWCWGGSAEGDGTLSPAAVGGIDGAVEVRSGPMNTFCARGDAGWSKCWHLQDGAWSEPLEVSALASASGLALASSQELCGIVSGGEVACQDPAGGPSATLSGSRGTTQLVGGLLTVCGGDGVGAWACWNIISPSLLQAVGAPRRELARGPFTELSTAGFRYCGLGLDGQVQCMESNAQPAQFAAVADLPE